jgi:hypothetical protein
VLRTVIVYIVLLRAGLAGKRELGQMTPFDLVVLLIIAPPSRPRWSEQIRRHGRTARGLCAA